VALQLGGSDPGELAHVARLAGGFGYAEVNLNCGCPSDRVQRGRFGACLMAEPERVAACVAAMQAATDLPVTVKCRIGIDDSEGFDFLARFVELIAAGGCRTFLVHARKAWLQGLSPKENREVPPLDHGMVRRLKAAFPALGIVVNGGIRTAALAADLARGLDGVMVGREAYENPWSLVGFEAALFGTSAAPRDRVAVVEAMVAYAERQVAQGVQLRSISRHMLGLFNGLPGARAWRRRLSGFGPDDGPDALRDAARLVAAGYELAA
jgi:tRNA-dihydrouridine synthase A